MRYFPNCCWKVFQSSPPLSFRSPNISRHFFTMRRDTTRSTEDFCRISRPTFSGRSYTKQNPNVTKCFFSDVSLFCVNFESTPHLTNLSNIFCGFIGLVCIHAILILAPFTPPPSRRYPYQTRASAGMSQQSLMHHKRAICMS